MSNGVIMQFFQWYTAADGTLWNELACLAQGLANSGFTAVWFPPCSKGSGGGIDVGYGQYDLFDLGEFDQKGSVRTKYGTKQELLTAVQAVQSSGMQAYADVVFNHKDAADDKEEVWVQEVDWNDRNRPLSDWYPIHAWTHFTFKGRGNTYSSMHWHWWCFDALSHNADTGDNSKLFRIKDKSFSTEVSHEHGNFDFLMANDIDMSVDTVRGELMYWGRWFIDTTGFDGFRIDAVKHIRSSWFRDWLNHLRVHFGGRELFSVGEYWSRDVTALHDYIAATGGVMSLFDVPLHYKFHEASHRGNGFDMRTLFDGTLVREQPAKAVTFVENHDTQPCQSLGSPVEPWFKPLAYALTLLRRDGYPCVFYADYYGAEYPNCLGGHPPVKLYSHRFLIDKFLQARRDYGFGDQHDYFDHPNTVGWVRLGTKEHPGAMAVVMTNGPDGSKWMNVFRADASFFDCTEHIPTKVRTNSDGWGNFPCKGGSVSVWLQE
jgi:alpha-amylase